MNDITLWMSSARWHRMGATPCEDRVRVRVRVRVRAPVAMVTTWAGHPLPGLYQ